MIIRRLVLHNFGVYSGENIFEFSGEKNVVLIGGMNGRGKTTILESILLALYGSNSFAYIESQYKSYGSYLKSYTNKTDGTGKSWVELEFQIDNNDNYSIKREWNGTQVRIKEEITVKHNGIIDVFLNDNWSMFMENLLPSGLSNFFFFDGEKIAELAAEETNEQMKESVRILLGIKVIDTLENDIKRIISKCKNNDKSRYDETLSNELRKNKEDAEFALKELDLKIESTINAILEKEKQIEATKIEYSSKGGDIVEKKQDLFNERAEIKAKIEGIVNSLEELAASELPLIMVEDYLNDVKKISVKERKCKENRLAMKKVGELYKNYDNKNSQEIKEFINYLNKSMKYDNRLIYDLSDASFVQLNELMENRIESKKAQTTSLFKKLNKYNKRLEEIDSYLSVEVDEKRVNKLYKQIVKLESEKFGLETELKIMENNRPNYNGRVITATSEFNKYVEGLLARLELLDDQERELKYTHYALDVLAEYKIKLQKKKIGKLAETMTECYKRIANKKSLISKIEIDATSLDFTCYGFNGEIIPKSRLSAGERQLMVISLLWALALCSKKKLPVIIDTPLSRLDSHHRMSLITTYFPYASEQTMILSTDSEIYGKYYDALKENVGNEFTLVYDEETKSTTICNGYLLEERQ